MRAPLSWLREYCDPGLDAASTADRLAMTGTEVERIERVGVGAPEGFVVGRVTSAERHPNADRLTVCHVDDGSGEERTIVCGAPNVAAGQTVAVALPGAVMPDGTRLGEAKLRGVLSSGMILAEDEVGVGEDHGGIMVLSPELEPGAALLDHLTIHDDVLELEITPNRPDCLAVYGIARELHAATEAPLGDDPGGSDAEPSGPDRASDHAAIEIADPDVCPRFTARVYEDVRVGPSPLWLKARLSATGQRPISNVVDITNYVMLLTGQPLHAFDLDEVRGRRIVVRKARAGERMATLDGVEREFDPEMALVCDAEGPTSIAGIMGGRVSEVSEQTTRVLMEAATWVGPNILRTSSRLGLRSEASTRFEKQLHPEQAMDAQRLAARLLVELCGARLVPGTLDAFPGEAPAPVVGLRPERVRSLLGHAVEREEIRAILERLGFGVAEADGDAGLEQPEGEPAFVVTVPGFRAADVQREADLIEEVARIHGLDRLPITLPSRERAVGRLSAHQRLRRRVEDALRDRGMLEIVAWSFTAPATLARLRLDPDEPLLRLANPLSEDQSVLRPLLLPGLLDAAAHNAARGRTALALFESAHVYRFAGSLEAPPGSPAGALPSEEPHHLAALLSGGLPGSWRGREQPADFYAVKALLEGVLDSVGLAWSVKAAELPFLHPGRAARIIVSDAGRVGEMGWIGELHPQVAAEWDLERVAAFELDFDALAGCAPRTAAYRELSAFPAVLQDIAVIVDEDRGAADVEAAVRTAGGGLLRSLRVFDLYRGEQIGEGRKSLALRLEFRAADRTLTDAEVAGVRAAIERELERLGGQLRA